MTTEQTYQQLIPQLKRIERIRILYLFFKRLNEYTTISLFLYIISLFLVGSSMGKWLNSSQLSSILIWVICLTQFAAAFLFNEISKVQKETFNIIIKAACPDFNIIKKKISDQKLINTGFFRNKDNAIMHNLSKGAISGKISGIHCELYDINIVTNEHGRWMLIPVIGAVLALLFWVLNAFKSLLKKIY